MFCLLAGCGSSKSEKASSEASTEDLLANLPEYKEVVIDNPEEYIKLGQYKGLTIEGVSSEITDQDVEADVQALIDNYTTYEEVTDRTDVQKGDFVDIDYICVIDGKENDTYSDTGMEVEIGTNELAEGLENVDFDKALMGHKINDTVKVTYTFPKDFYDPEVAQKKCEQTITIKKISKKVVPELNDAFIKDKTDYNTVDEYRKAKKAELEDAAREEADQTAKQNLMDAIFENSTQLKDFPEDMIAQEQDNIIAENAETAAAYGMTTQSFFDSAYGMSLEEAAKENLKFYCVVSLLQKELKIEVTDQDVQDYINKMIADSDSFSSADDVYEVGYTDEIIKNNIAFDRITEILLPETKVNIVKSDEEDAGVEQFLE